MTTPEGPTSKERRPRDDAGCGCADGPTPDGLSRRTVLQGAAATAALAAGGSALLNADPSWASPKSVSYDPPAPRYEVTLEPDVRVPCATA